MPQSKASKRRHNFVRRVRAEEALTAYETALRWVDSLSAQEVINQLIAKINSCRHEVEEAESAAKRLEVDSGDGNS